MKFPPPFTELTEAEMKIYKRIWESVEGFVGVSDVDNFLVTMAAQSLNIASDAMKRIKEKNGGVPIQIFEKTGAHQVSPDFTIYRTASKQAIDYLNKAGLTPTERNKRGVVRKDIIIEEEKEEEKAEKGFDQMAAWLGVSDDEKTIN